MKNIFASLLTFLSILPAMASEPKLKTILALKPGESLAKIQKANIGFKLENIGFKTPNLAKRDNVMPHLAKRNEN